ncbi:hypothetical protein G4Y79_04725 [Phototrophicus methaneseepsis]|uniref:Uncharacterized protein n=1 Tax=Phototrophicus methaneseepsis TaxID=2710758 RepID=A0A7S8EB35_9CHLR|nr:DUF6375 family protein [Phototrophicus methaneseepsis]QPC83690.1 hypothetical protein G4Y79_04725 [Phototrophicus methaneseepsis]
MKISIWQQFGSNHSSDFTVVGTFKSVSDAEQAAQTLLEIFGYIVEQRIDIYDAKLVPAEVWYAEQYNIAWDRHLDWLYNADQQVTQLENTVIVSSYVASTWMGAAVIDELLPKLGASVQQDGEMSNGGLIVTVTARVPHSATAQRLEQVTNDYLSALASYLDSPDYTSMPSPISPWAFYFVGKPEVSEDAIVAAYNDQQANHKKLESIREEMRQLGINGVPDKVPRISELQQKHNDMAKPFINTEKSKLADWYFWAFSNAKPYAYTDTPSTSHAAGDKLIIENLNFGINLVQGLPALIRWLRDEGCTVDFSIELKSWES